MVDQITPQEAEEFREMLRAAPYEVKLAILDTIRSIGCDVLAAVQIDDAERLADEIAETIAESLDDIPDLTPREHEYLSTACMHEMHDRCRMTCKWCTAGCRCTCHGKIER